MNTDANGVLDAIERLTAHDLARLLEENSARRKQLMTLLRAARYREDLLTRFDRRTKAVTDDRD